MAARHYQWRVSSKPTQVRWRDAARFVYTRSKRATGSDAFRKNNEKIIKRANASGALPFVYLKFYVSHFYF
jgi:hypothetical protein